MQTCDYCGRESEQAASHCRECGSSFLTEPEQSGVKASFDFRELVPRGFFARLLPQRSSFVFRALYFLSGLTWLLMSIFFGAVLIRFMQTGAGVQWFAFIFSSASVLLGVIHFVGLVLAMFASLAFGIGFLTSALHPKERS